MMLQVKNFSKIVLCALLLLAAGCKKDENGPDVPTSPSASIYGNIDQPDWAVPTDYDMTSSMTAIVRVTLLADYQSSEEDMLAAFSGATCIGVGSYNAQYNAYWLYIAALTSGGEVTLKHYSAAYRNIFVATATIPFRNDAQLGTISAPYTPQWRVAD